MNRGRRGRRRDVRVPEARARRVLDNPPVPSRRAADAWFKGFTVLVAVVCLGAIFATPIADTDFWWHLKTGQYVAERHTLPAPDPFAYTTAMAAANPGEASVRGFNLTHEWLSQLSMYGVYELAGYAGIVLARIALLLAVCGLAGLLAGRLSKSFTAGVVAGCATAGVMTAFTADRPSLVSFVGIAVFVAVLETGRAYWILPPLALLWSNCHGGFPLGWVVLAAYCAEAALRARSNPESWRLWLAGACAIVASGINPNGFRAVWVLWAYRRSPMTANLIEWMPPKLWGPPYLFDVLLFAAALTLAFSWRKVRPAHWILFAMFAAASVTAFRNIPLIGFLGPAVIAAYFPFSVKRPVFPAWAPAAAAAVAAAIFVARNGAPQFGVAEWTIPRGAANFLLEHHVTGPMFNTYEQGGYLIWRLWPEERVFIDGRSLSETVYRDYKQILFAHPSDQVTGPRAELLDRYGVRVVVMNTMDYVSGALYPLAIALANPDTKDWELTYEDTQAVVFMRRPPGEIAAIPNKFGHVLRHLDRECTAYIENSPDDALCARTLADYWLQNRVENSARRMLRLYLEHTPQGDPKAERALRELDGNGR